MTDVIEGMARAIRDVVERDGPFFDCRVAAQAAMDYLKQPQPAPEPDHQCYCSACVEMRFGALLVRYWSDQTPASKPTSSEGQGPELSQEQIEAMNRFKAVWQPIADVLRGDAP